MKEYDVIRKLIGPITPIGETNEDAIRFDNLLKLTYMIDLLLEDIIEVSSSRMLYQHSIKKAGELAFDWCKITARQLDEVGNE